MQPAYNANFFFYNGFAAAIYPVQDFVAAQQKGYCEFYEGVINPSFVDFDSITLEGTAVKLGLNP